MRAPKSSPTLRSYLAGIVIAMVAPVVVLVAYDLSAESDKIAAHASREASDAARFGAQNAARTLAEARTALAILAQHPLIREFDPEHCAAALGALVEANRLYANWMVRDAEGRVVCGAREDAGRYTQLLATREAFEAALLSNRFLVSEPVFGRITGRWVAVLRHPVRDGAGRPVGLINVPIDLVRFSSLALGAWSASRPLTRIVDASGTVVASSEPHWIGRNVRGEALVAAALEGAGGVRAVGPDGVECFYGSAQAADTAWRVVATVPIAQAYAGFVPHVQISIAVALMVMLVGVGVWFWMAQAVTRPIERIAALAQRVAAGDEEARAEPGNGPLEVRSVVRQFNAMLDAQRGAKARLREGEERFRHMAMMSSDWFWEQDENLRYTAVFGDLQSLSGVPRETFLGKTRWDTPYGDISEEEVCRHNALLEARKPFRNLEYSRVGADGELRWRSVTGQPVFDAQGRFKGYRGTARDITERVEREQALRESEARLRRALAERERLARDLHDGIVQSIYAVGLGLEHTRRLLGAHAQAAGAGIAEAIARLNEVIREVRRYIAFLEPRQLDAAQLRRELESAVRVAAHGMQFDLEAEESALTHLSPRVSFEVMNIVHEAVSNSLRHSGGKRGTVRLGLREGAVHLEISDDGAGFDASDPRQHGQGLRNIAARAQLLAAKLAIRSAAGQGTCIMVDIPLDSDHAPG